MTDGNNNNKKIQERCIQVEILDIAELNNSGKKFI